jgi:hypothetical protein
MVVNGEHVDAIASRYPDVDGSIQREGNVLQRYSFGALAACPHAFNEFMLWSDGLQTRLVVPEGSHRAYRSVRGDDEDW